MSIIELKGAQEHNLKNIDVTIPKNKLVAFTGVSGSGKSSLVFHTLYAEAFRRFADASQIPVYIMGRSSWSALQRPRFRSLTGLPPALGLSQRQGVASKLSTVGTISGISDLWRVYFAAYGQTFCKKCRLPLTATDPKTVVHTILSDFLDQKISFVTTVAEKRKGAFATEIEHFRQLGFSKLRVNDELFALQGEKPIPINGKKLNTIEIIIDVFTITPDKQSRIERTIHQCITHGKGIVRLESGAKTLVFNTSSSCPQCHESAPKCDPRHFSHSSLGKCSTCDGLGSQKQYLPSDLFPCPVCEGSRLSPKRPFVTVKDATYEELHRMPLGALHTFVSTLTQQVKLEKDAGKLKILGEMQRLLQTVVHLNLDHLVLNRSGASLAPGDLQRLRLASMISNNLTGALYVADEPCQGLTRSEVHNLASLFRGLLGNQSSVIAVEHHPSFLAHCDTVYTMGPGAGLHGGQVVRQDTGKHFAEEPIKKQKITVPKDLEESAGLVFSGVQVRNLQQDEIIIPQGRISLIRGPSGAGKATFVELCLLPALIKLGAKYDDDDAERAQHITVADFCRVKTLTKDTQAQIVTHVRPGSMTRASRRIVASALEALQPLRALFAQLPASQVMGLTENHFSWSSALGRCAQCEGRGYIELPQRYAQPIRVPCEVCLGSKLSSRSLVPRFKGYNFADLMNLTLEQAVQLLSNQSMVNKLTRACQFGLGYIRLGQGMEMLSGGELQRLTLTLQLKRANLSGMWFILTHPSTGLHKPDIQILGKLMQEMSTKGASFVLVENREEFLPFAHQVLSFG